MIIDFSEYLGQIKNDTGILGKAFIFNVIIDKEPIVKFDCILFIHETVEPFLSLREEDKVHDSTEIIKKIFEKYSLKQLLEA